MSSPPLDYSPPPRPPIPRRYLIASLIMLVVSIANIDRMNMSVAAPVIQSRYHLNDFQIGLVLSAFFWTYSAVLPLAGWLLDRFGKALILPLAVLFWTLSSSAMALVSGVAVLCLVRLLLGIGEAPCMPSCNLVIREWSPLRERALFTAMMQGGAIFGPGLAAAPAAFLIKHHGWRLSFLVLSSLGFLWLLLWWFLYAPPERARWLAPAERDHILASRKPPESANAPHTPMTLLSILCHRSSIGIYLAAGPLTYALYFLVTWLPGYLTNSERHFDLLKSGNVTSASFLLATAAAIFLSLLSDKFILFSHAQARCGYRRFALAASMLLALLPLLFTPYIANPYLLIASIACCLAFVTLAITLLYALTTDLIVHEPSAGRTFALVSFNGQLMGFIAPALTGFIAQHFGFTPTFLLTAALLAAGAIAALFLPTQPLQPRAFPQAVTTTASI
ncbi:MAG: MFS transporter [Phycisphaerae bacterium]